MSNCLVALSAVFSRPSCKQNVAQHLQLVRVLSVADLAINGRTDEHTEHVVAYNMLCLFIRPSV